MSHYNPLKCPICNEYFNIPLCLDCGHVICNNCLNLLQTKKCPICNNQLTSNHYPIIYCLNNPTTETINIYDEYIVKNGNEINGLKQQIEIKEKQLQTHNMTINKLKQELETMITSVNDTVKCVNKETLKYQIEDIKRILNMPMLSISSCTVISTKSLISIKGQDLLIVNNRDQSEHKTCVCVYVKELQPIIIYNEYVQQYICYETNDSILRYKFINEQGKITDEFKKLLISYIRYNILTDARIYIHCKFNGLNYNYIYD